MRCLIIIPAYNEEENIYDVVQTVKQLNNNQIDYLVINDCSKDRTELICRNNSFDYVSLPNNLGIGGAVQTGYIYARDNNYDVAVQIDGDGQHDVNEIFKLLELMNDTDADMVIGSRYIDKEGFQSSAMRRVGITFLSILVKLRTGKRVLDITSGFRAVNHDLIEAFSRDYPADYPEPESTTRSLLQGKRVVECPVIMHNRGGDESSIRSFKTIYYMVKVSLAIILCQR